jgi:steroid delta-isomerase-like uncharacterized protein
MIERKDTFAHRWFEEVWNQGSAAAIDELTHPDLIAHGLTDAAGNEITGVPAFKTFHDNLRSAFPDLDVTVEDTVMEDDMLVARCRVRATHSGNGLGIEATGNPVDFTGMSMMRIVDGRIVENWDSYDFLTMMQQVGLVKLGA